MKNIMRELVDRMFNEKEDFHTYLDMFYETHDHKEKAIFLKLAEAEGDHYKMLYDIIFEKEPATSLEFGLHKHAKEDYDKMLKCIKTAHEEMNAATK